MPLPAFARSRKESLLSIASSNNTNGASPLGRPPSPTFSTTTTASAMNLSSGPDVIITRADLRKSTSAYDELLNAVTDYRSALATVSNASARLGDALERCARLKGVSDDSAIGMQAASGLQHLIANHERVLDRSLLTNVEDPLRQHLSEYKASIADRSAKYEATLLEKSKIIRKTETENMTIGRRKQRDLNSFRAALSILQAQVNELDKLKGGYYQDVLNHEEEIWEFVLSKVSFIVRSSLDVYDRITSKSSDPHLEPLLLTIPDPFDSYGPQKTEDQIFSILPPLAIMAPPGASSASGTPVTGSPEQDGNMDSQSSSLASSAGGGMRTWMDLPVDEPLDHHQNRIGAVPSATVGPSTGSYYSEWADVKPTLQGSSSSGRRFSVPPPVTPPFPPLPPPRTTSLGKTARSPPGGSKLRSVLSAIEGSDESDETQTVHGTQRVTPINGSDDDADDSSSEAADAWSGPDKKRSTSNGARSDEGTGDVTPRTSSFNIAGPRPLSPTPPQTGTSEQFDVEGASSNPSEGVRIPLGGITSPSSKSQLTALPDLSAIPATSAA